jgi:hypothetical protein
MKKSIETAIALHILTIILPVITLYSWKGLEVLIGIAIFQRANFKKIKINM